MIDLRLGDCVEQTREIESSSIDLILTSPPYDNLRKYSDGSTFDFEALAGQLKRVMKPGGVLVWVVNDQSDANGKSGTSFRHALHFKGIGLNLHDTMIWRKLNPMMCGSPTRYTPEFDYMLVMSRGRPRTINRLTEPCRQAGMKSRGLKIRVGGVRCPKPSHGKPIKETKPRGNVWEFACDGRGFSGHPAVFPLQLAIDHILSWTNPGDVVLDPFIGSGTTGEACIRTGRNFLGIEISQEYLKIAERRIKSAMLPLFRAN